MNNLRTFRSSMDSFTAQTTNWAMIAMVVSLYLMGAYYRSTRNGLIVGTASFVILVFLMAWLVTARSYRVSEDELVINCFLFPVRIPREDIMNVGIIPADEIFMARLFAFGGVFGYTGIYFVRQLGKVYVYGRKNSGDRVAVTLVNGKIYLLSPDDAPALADTLS